MKTLYGTFGFVVLAVIVIVAGLAIRAFAFATPPPARADYTFVLRIGKTDTDWVEISDKAAFDRALRPLKPDQYHIHFLPKEGATPIPDYHPPAARVSVKTDKITTSQMAQSAQAGESAANDPNATHRVASNNPTEVQAVLATLRKK